ncbi:hypothetical protein [Clostridium tertium]|uniref:hypothetical protein n=1 Tax=Clostridium tertium TaxID=1559 RepID=UPI00159669D7|nr:hypothetical protein [Clostridium tertium]
MGDRRLSMELVKDISRNNSITVLNNQGFLQQNLLTLLENQNFITQELYLKLI